MLKDGVIFHYHLRMYDKIDTVLHQRVRLAIVSILIKVKKVDFLFKFHRLFQTLGAIIHKISKQNRPFSPSKLSFNIRGG